jgi:hypothetical protein
MIFPKSAKEIINTGARDSARSAGLHPAVSRISNPQAAVIVEGVVRVSGLPSAIRRYGRLQICATVNSASHAAAGFRQKTAGSGRAFLYRVPSRI